MKKYIFTLVLGLTGLVGYAWDFEARVYTQDEWNYVTWKFDWVEEGKTCKTAAGTGFNIQAIDENTWLEVNGKSHQCPSKRFDIPYAQGPNNFGWKNFEFPSQVQYGDKMVTIVEIGDFSFANNLQSSNKIVLPPTIKKIGKGAFLGVNNNFGEATLEFSNIESIGDFAFFNSGFKNVVINNVDTIGKYAFAQQYSGSISSLKFENVRVIDEGAFYNITGLQSLKISDSTTDIGPYAFYKAQVLADLDLGTGVKTIGNNAFSGAACLTSIKIPDSTTWIGDHAFCYCFNACPIVLGGRVEHIGESAFFMSTYKCGNNFEIPASVKFIGPRAFDFTRTADVRETDTDITDIYVGAAEPPAMPYENGYSGFGDKRDSSAKNFWDVDGEWMYRYICLHVPQGSFEKYKNHPEWGKFTCIIDDIVDSNLSFDNIVGYVFMVPGEVTNITHDIIPNVDKELFDKCEWSFYHPSDDLIATLETKEEMVNGVKEKMNYIIAGERGANGEIIPGTFGQRIAVGRVNLGQYTEQAGGPNNTPDRKEVGPTIVGCVVVYVCPTVIVAYNTNDNNQPKAPQRNGVAPLKVEASEGDYVTPETVGLSTYEHRVVYNSYPQMKVEPALGFELITKHNDATDDRQWVEAELQPVDPDYEMEDDVTIALPNPIVNNRILYVELLRDNDQSLGTTDVKELELDGNIKIVMNGHTVTVEGAADSDVVTVVNMHGQVLHQSVQKSFNLEYRGVYVVKVANVAVKIILR